MNIDSKILKIHNYIYANEGLSAQEVLEELLKIFYCKILDERQGGKGRLSVLFDEYKSRLKGIIPADEKINLKPRTVDFILNELSDIKFSEISSDIKGHILQKILDRSYRESRGQFFTPAPVVDFMVKMIAPIADETGADPACGTGSFLFEALKYSGAKPNNLYFYDISKNLIKLAAMRMMFEFDGAEGNFTVKDGISDDFDKKFDYIITNPPFGSQGKISDPKILAKYRLGTGFKSQSPEILFVEKIIKMLKEGGRAAILLPKGILETPTLEYFRKYLTENTRIDAVVSLPDKTFSPYGTNVQSAILFLTKMKPPENYKVFFGQITKLGYTFIKHSKPLLRTDGSLDEDYNEVLQKFKQTRGTVSIKEIISNKYSLSCEFFNPEYQSVIDFIRRQKHARLKDLVEFQYKKTKFDADKIYNYIEITDINPLTNEIFNFTGLSGAELPGRASYRLREGGIIVANSGSSIGTPKHAKALIDKDFEGYICTNGFTLMYPVKISPYYLIHFFGTKEFRCQILKLRYGSAIPTITKEDFENILVPLPENDRIEVQMRQAVELRRKAKEIINNI